MQRLVGGALTDGGSLAEEQPPAHLPSDVRLRRLASVEAPPTSLELLLYSRLDGTRINTQD